MKFFTLLIFTLIGTIARAQLTPEWEVNSLNTGKGFADIQILSDGSILAELIYCSSRSDLPGNFFDAQKKAVPYENNYTYDHEFENQKTLIRFNPQGVYQWCNSYQNNDYHHSDSEFDFIAYQVIKGDQILVLAKYNEIYFQRQDKEKKEQAYYEDRSRLSADSLRLKYGEEEYYEDEYYEEDYEEEEYDGEAGDENTGEEVVAEDAQQRSMYALQFLNPLTGEVDSILFLPHLNAACTEIYNIEKTGTNTLVLAGVTSSAQIAITDSVYIEHTEEMSGSFVATINIKDGNVLWADFISHTPQTYFYLNPFETHSCLSVAGDGTIYFSTEHSGDVVFSNQMHVHTDSVDEHYHSSQWVYLISYTKDGKINWIKNNRSNSSIHTMTCTDKGVYLAQYSFGKQSFDLPVDTANGKYVCVSFVNKNGAELWTVNFPNAYINSIQMDHKGLPVIQGVYNGITLRTNNFQINNKRSLNKENDFFIIKLTNKGEISSVFTDRLWIQDHLYTAPSTFTYTQSGTAYLSYHTNHWFTEKERKTLGIYMPDMNAFADETRLVKINLKKLKFE